MDKFEVKIRSLSGSKAYLITQQSLVSSNSSLMGGEFTNP